MSYMVNPLPPISDQDRVLLYNDNTVSSRWLVRIKKSIRRESLVYPVQNSSNLLHGNCVADRKENYKINEILEVEGVRLAKQSILK